MINDDMERIKREIMASTLPIYVTTEFPQLAVRYRIEVDDVRNLFYEIVCDSRFDTCKDNDDRLRRAVSQLGIVCNQRFKKQEAVDFVNSFAQYLYDKIDHIVIVKGIVMSDDPKWEFYFDNQVYL